MEVGRRRKGDEGKSMGPGGGGGEWIKMSSLYPIDYEGGGWGMNWSFVDTFGFLSLHWNFVRTPTKDIIVPTKYL